MGQNKMGLRMKPKLEHSFRKMDMETDHNHAEAARLLGQ